MTDATTLHNPTIEVLGENGGAFERMNKRINQLDGLLHFLHVAGDTVDGPHRDYVIELASETAYEIRVLADLINSSRPAGHDIDAMRMSYRQTVEAAEALIEAVNIKELSALPSDKVAAIVIAITEMEGHIDAARDDFLGKKETQA